MRKVGWKRYLGWAFVAGLVCAILLAATWKAWLPSGIRVALLLYGAKADRVSWEGKDSLKFEGLEFARDGATVRIISLVTLTPYAWKKALRQDDTNQVYFTVDQWRVILKSPQGTNKVSLAANLRRYQEAAEDFWGTCPRANILNGVIQTEKGEFRFGALQWNNGQLTGDVSWPLLNDPADFRLSITNVAKTQFTLKQIGLDIGARVSAERAGENARLAGYVRWATNRADFDLLFSPDSAAPIGGYVRSKGVGIPGRFLGTPFAEQLDARFSLAVTNGQFDFRLGAPEID